MRLLAFALMVLGICVTLAHLYGFVVVVVAQGVTR